MVLFRVGSGFGDGLWVCMPVDVLVVALTNLMDDLFPCGLTRGGDWKMKVDLQTNDHLKMAFCFEVEMLMKRGENIGFKNV